MYEGRGGVMGKQNSYMTLIGVHSTNDYYITAYNIITALGNMKL